MRALLLLCALFSAAEGLALAPGGFRAAVRGYDGVLLDQFGVIHDGKKAYPGAVRNVEWLIEEGKTVVVLSNSSRRKHEAVKKLAAMGFPPLAEVVTSGEATWQLLSTRPQAPFDAALGTRCLVFGNREDDGEYVESAGCVLSDVSSADFLLARGLFCVEDGSGTQDYEEAAAHAMLAVAAGRGLPMVVSNPDLVRPDGKASPMPGVLARHYEGIGGTVHYVGKPHPLVYEQALRALSAAGVARERVVGVGDSLLHDVKGAAAAGVDSIFIASGIHAEELGLSPQGAAEATAETAGLVDGLSARLLEGARATAWVPNFAEAGVP